MLQFAVRCAPAVAPDARASSKHRLRPAAVPGKEFFHFATEGSGIAFAGSRHIELDEQLCLDLVSGFGSLGTHFFTGCAAGVDSSFRRALGESVYQDRSFVACAFHSKAASMELPAGKVVPDGLPAKVALAKRTVYLCTEADLLILFPSSPAGPGSTLAFTTMIQANKPVFLVQEAEPEQSPDYDVYPSGLFGVVRGFWCLPHVHRDERGLIL